MGEISKVYVVFKTHLDIGFTDFAASVRQQYMDSFIPAALRIARQQRESGSVERFIWTTGSWLIYEYLEAATSARRRQMESAIEHGDIAWHGLPFTTHSELQDAGLFKAGLALSQRLDSRFGKHTLAAKMTDVPGHTRAIVPLLAEAGIRFLHIGVNSASTAPDVPDVFVWRHDDGSEVVVAYDKSGYGAITQVPGLSSVLAIAHTNDNTGPGDAADIKRVYDNLRRRYPAAAVVAARLDDFAGELPAIQSQLPVVTQEIGDTWIHGVGTDPTKVAKYRELARLRKRWLDDGIVQHAGKRIDRFSRSLMLVPEHTWGMDEKTFLGDYSRYDTRSLRRLRRTARCRHYESSWAEQRRYIEQAVSALGNKRLRQQARRALDALKPARQAGTGWRRLTDPLAMLETAYFTLAVNENGAMRHLVDKRTGVRWAAPQRLLGLFRYETFSVEDYERFGQQYVRGWPHAVDWAIKDFTKPGMEAVAPPHFNALARISSGYALTTADACRFRFILHTPDDVVKHVGCPAQLSLELAFRVDSPSIFIDLQWFDKQANRLPEAVWFSFQPVTTNRGSWWLSKMGMRVSPLEVVRDGNRHLHATSQGVEYEDGDCYLHINSLDAPLVAPGQRSLLDSNNRKPAPGQGMHFNLYNNIWGTNFPMWYDEDARFRFLINFGKSGR